MADAPILQRGDLIHIAGYLTDAELRRIASMYAESGITVAGFTPDHTRNASGVPVIVAVIREPHDGPGSSRRAHEEAASDPTTARGHQ